MSTEFRPFASGAPLKPDAPGEFRARVISRENVSSAFQPIAPPAPAEKQKTPPHVNGVNGAPCGQPSVTVRREGDRVTGICVQCACGEVIELACVY
jgi:hypothetical protein